MSIAQKLRDLRGNTPIKEVAKEIGVTSQAISNYEAGTRIPQDETKIKLAKYYETTVGELFYNEEN